jgi:LCP family protein required for cell wall assembly
VLSFLRRFAVALLIVALIAGLAVVLGDRFARDRFAASRRVHVPNLVPAYPGKPANYLLIGSDSRQGEDAAFGSPSQTPGRRSDVMMVVHVEPQARTGMLVSFPRDLVVNIPGHGRSRLNSAYELGGANGPQLVVQTLEDNFPPLKINHYIEVDFHGFQSIVDAIGKIHLFFPTPAHDPYTGLNVDTSGCVAVNGATALAYARSRHYYVPKNPARVVPWQWNYSTAIPEGAYRGGAGWTATGSDLDRIPRQQYFLRTLAQAAIDKTAARPDKLYGLLNAVSKNFTHDDTLTFDELKALVRTFNDVSPAKIDMESIPVVASKYPGFAGAVDPDIGTQVLIDRLMNFEAKPPPAQLLAPPDISVRVVNGSGMKNAAAAAVAQFKTAGFRVEGQASDADRSDYANTQIRYAPGAFNQGYTVAHAVNTLHLVQADSTQNTLGADVLVVVGRDYATLKHLFPNQPGASNASTSSTASISTTSTSTTTSSVPKVSDARFLPVDPKTGGPLVGCPT